MTGSGPTSLGTGLTPITEETVNVVHPCGYTGLSTINVVPRSVTPDAWILSSMSSAATMADFVAVDMFAEACNGQQTPRSAARRAEMRARRHYRA